MDVTGGQPGRQLCSSDHAMGIQLHSPLVPDRVAQVQLVLLTLTSALQS